MMPVCVPRLIIISDSAKDPGIQGVKNGFVERSSRLFDLLVTGHSEEEDETADEEIRARFVNGHPGKAMHRFSCRLNTSGLRTDRTGQLQRSPAGVYYSEWREVGLPRLPHDLSSARWHAGTRWQATPFVPYPSGRLFVNPRPLPGPFPGKALSYQI